MRLTTDIRSAFIASVMNDVPSIDYHALAVRIVQEDHAKQMHPKIRAVYDDVELRGHLESVQRYVSGIGYISVYSCGTTLSKEAEEATAEASRLSAAQETARNALEIKLAGVARSVNTTQQLIKALPEFEKYLPTEEAKSTNLPAIANLMADFMHAGWPKGKEAAP